MAARQEWLDLSLALSDNLIPAGDTGLVVAIRFLRETRYAVLQVTPFRTVRRISLLEDQSVEFEAEGEKVFLLYEPTDYSNKFDEPYLRNPEELIPLRFAELLAWRLHNGDRIFMNRDAYQSTGAVNLQRPSEGSFAIYVRDEGQLEERARRFLDSLLREDFRVEGEVRSHVVAAFGEHVARIHAADTGTG